MAPSQVLLWLVPCNSLKVSEVLDELNEDVRQVKELHGQEELAFQYQDKDHTHDLLYVYAKGSLQIGKLYAPAAVVGITSITLLTGSHIQMNRRNAALMAAYTAVQEAYDKYRERVRLQLGEEREAENFITASGTDRDYQDRW